jgi:hypothetical protein
MAVKMGFQGLMYYGTAGATGSTPITNRTDVTITTSHQYGDTTITGDGSAVPLETSDVTITSWTAEWTMLNDTSDTALAAFRAAAAAGSAIALRMKDYSSGKGFDGDVLVEERSGRPLKGEQTFQFSVRMTRKSGRNPQLYV